jgi:hypothetical protein
MSITHLETAAPIDLTDWNAAHVVSEWPSLGQSATGRYYALDSTTDSGAPAAAGTSGRMCTQPVFFRAGTIDRIGVYITAGAGSSVVRLGIYSTSSGIPGSLLVDGGTVATTSTGFKEVTVSQVVSAGLYWLAAVAQTATPDWAYCQSPRGQLSETSAGNYVYYAYTENSVTGSLPGTATPAAITNSASHQPRIWWRYSA